MTQPTGTARPPKPPRDEGQWALGNREPLNANEQFKKDDDALNVRARHYLCVAMIMGLRRAQWRSLIYTMRYGDLPKDMHDDIYHAGNTIPEPFQKWRNRPNTTEPSP